MSSSLPPPASRGRFRPVSGHTSVRSSRPKTATPATSGTAPGPATSPPPARTTPTSSRSDVVLEVQDLKTYFFTYDGVVRALEGINLQVRAGQTTGIVGETGCGKSVTAFSIARLISEPGRVISGKILFQGANLLWGLDKEAKYRRQRGTNRVKVIRSFRRIKAGNERMAAVRGRGIGMVFQEPGQAMNPVFSIADQLGEAILLHRGLEVVDGLLAADRSSSQMGQEIYQEFVHEPDEGAPREIVAGPSGDIDRMLQTAATGTREELRAAAAKLAADVGLPSLAPELFYQLRDAGPKALQRRSRIVKILQRAHLTPMQRRYLRHQRTMMQLQQQIKDLYFREMKTGKALTGARGQVALRMRYERLRHFYFGLWGIKGTIHRPIKNELFWRVVTLLEGFQIANPVQVSRGFPHELSGGMLQRAMIAMALSCEPALLLADEPTTALDVTIQAQILELMRDLRDRVGTAIVLITHDLGVVAEVCDRVNVMYAGMIIESGSVHEVFRRPLHPYTQGLLASIPRFDQPDKELSSIPGSVPNLISPPPGCRFHPRCPYAMPVCKEVRPVPQYEGQDHMVACHLYTEGQKPA